MLNLKCPVSTIQNNKPDGGRVKDGSPYNVTFVVTFSPPKCELKHSMRSQITMVVPMHIKGDGFTYLPGSDEVGFAVPKDQSVPRAKKLIFIARAVLKRN